VFCRAGRYFPRPQARPGRPLTVRQCSHTIGAADSAAQSHSAIMREHDLINWICSHELDSSVVVAGPGDDCAVIVLGEEQVLVTVDQLLDGVHFDLARCGGQAAGRKAMARSLSDIAAMAGEATAAVVSLAIPAGCDEGVGKDIYRGLRGLGEQFGCAVAGGDVAVWAGRLAISVTVVGRCAGVKPVLRSGARVGDAICVTGQLGGAWRHQRDLTFRPRLTEARQLAGRCEVHAMIDLSDGLATDLRHMCDASGVGAELQADAIPVHPQSDGLKGALCDGEDYELLFAVSPAEAGAIAAEGLAGTMVSLIGTITEGREIVLADPDGKRGPLKCTGWEHTG